MKFVKSGYVIGGFLQNWEALLKNVTVLRQESATYCKHCSYSSKKVSLKL